MEMRAVFGAELARIMETDERIVVLDADLAKANGTMNLKKQFPERAIDVGIAEQNMASVAAGLASYGFIPFITSFTPFATRRIADQIAVSIAYSKMPVKIVGTDPGISAGLNGGSHMSMEDIGVIRSIPDILIFEPVDEVQLKQAIPQLIAHNGPVYMRLFRKEIKKVFDDDYKFDLHKADVLREGTDVTLCVSGIMTQEAVLAADILAAAGIKAELINVHTLKPLDGETILKSIKKTGCAVTAENHNIYGGLRSAVAELVCESHPVPVLCVGVNDSFGEACELSVLKDIFSMNAADIAGKVKMAVLKK